MTDERPQEHWLNAIAEYTVHAPNCPFYEDGNCECAVEEFRATLRRVLVPSRLRAASSREADALRVAVAALEGIRERNAPNLSPERFTWAEADDALREIQRLRAPAPGTGGEETEAVPVAFLVVRQRGGEWTAKVRPAESSKADDIVDALPEGQHPLYLRAPSEGTREPGEDYLEVLERESWDLRCHDGPTSVAGDTDIYWTVVEHHMSEPHERVIGSGSTPWKALEDALRPAPPIQGETDG